MFYAEEDETCFNEAMSQVVSFRNERKFVMPFVDAMDNEGFKLIKTRSTKADHISKFFCCCCPWNRCWKCCHERCYDYDNDQAERGFMTFT